MQLCHKPAPLRKARQIDFEKRSIFTVLTTRWCGWRGLPLGEHECAVARVVFR
jgi:hypothetical protein